MEIRNLVREMWNKHSETSMKVHSLIQSLGLWRKILLDSIRSEQETYWSWDLKSGKRNLQQAFSTSMKVHFLIQSLALQRKILLDSLRRDQEAYCSVEIQHLVREINRITWGDLCVFKELWTSRVDCDDNCSSQKCIWILLLQFISFSSKDFPPIIFSSRKESEEDARKSLSKTSYY